MSTGISGSWTVFSFSISSSVSLSSSSWGRADSAAASLMRAGRVDQIVAGADRIAANGDTANKIGTYMLAVLAHHHQIPFIIAAPSSTLDPSLPDGSYIPVEERQASELTHFEELSIAPAGTPVFNPAFDVTPAELIAGIITEKGLIQPVNEAAIRALLSFPRTALPGLS